MANSAVSTRHPARSQVLHSNLAECQRPIGGNDYDGTGSTAYGGRSTNTQNIFQAESSSAAELGPTRGRQQTRPPTREEQHQELMRNFRKRYTIDAVPTMTQFRLSSTVAGYRVSADVCKPRKKDPYISLGVKLGEDPLLLKKIVLTPQHSDIRMFTPAMEIGILQLQFSFGFDWTKRTFGCAWRCKTKWTRGSKLQRRFKHYTSDKMELTTFWNIRSELPQMGGSFGSHSSSVQTDIGRLLVDFDRIKAAVRL